MPDDQQQEPLRKTEPVVVGDLVDLVVILAGTAGVVIPDDVAAKVVAAVVAVVVWVQSTYFKRKSVTPETRAEDREQAAYADGVAAGKQLAPATATVVQVDVPHVDVEPIADPPPSFAEPSGGRVGQNSGKPAAGLLDGVDL